MTHVAIARGSAKWEADSTSTACRLCSAGFTFLRRRHHCRKCGILCCHACSTGKILFGAKRMRTCDACLEELQRAETAAAEAARSRRAEAKRRREEREADALAATVAAAAAAAERERLEKVKLRRAQEDLLKQAEAAAAAGPLAHKRKEEVDRQKREQEA